MTLALRSRPAGQSLSQDSIHAKRRPPPPAPCRLVPSSETWPTHASLGVTLASVDASQSVVADVITFDAPPIPWLVRSRRFADHALVPGRHTTPRLVARHSARRRVHPVRHSVADRIHQSPSLPSRADQLEHPLAARPERPAAVTDRVSTKRGPLSRGRPSPAHAQLHASCRSSMLWPGHGAVLELPPQRRCHPCNVSSASVPLRIT